MRYRRSWCVAVVGFSLLLGACGSLTFEHPLADEQTSVADAATIGVWELERVKRDEDAKDTPKARVFIGRSKAAEGVLEAVFLTHKDERVHVNVLRLFGSKVAGRQWWSIPAVDLARSFGKKDVPEGEASAYVLVCHEVVRGRILRIGGLDSDAVAAAVQDGELEGHVERKHGKSLIGEIEIKNVRVTASSKKLTAWIAAHPEAVKMGDDLRFRRLDVDGDDGLPREDRDDEAKAREDYEKAPVAPPVWYEESRLRVETTKRGLFADLPPADPKRIADLIQAFQRTREAAARSPGKQVGGPAGQTWVPSDAELELAEVGVRLQAALDHVHPEMGAQLMRGIDLRYSTFQERTVKVFGTGYVRVLEPKKDVIILHVR